MGRIGRRAFHDRANVTAEEAMTPGPSTIRPSARLRAIVERMRRENLTTLSVTPDGRFEGLLTLPDADEARRRLGDN
jgi:CBS domain-containing protein